MNIVIDNNGFVLYATPFAVPSGELSTTISLPTNLNKPKLVNDEWIEEATNEELLEIKSKLICQHL